MPQPYSSLRILIYYLERVSPIILRERFLFSLGAMNSSNAFIRIQSILLTEIDISAQTQSVVTIVTATDLKNID